MGRPHPPLKSVLGLGAEGFSKPGPGSHTIPRTDRSEITTASEICSSGDSPAWRTLLVTSSLTISRTSSSFSRGKTPSSRSRVWRAAKTASEVGVSLRSICVIESRAESARVTTYPRYYVYTLIRKYYYQSERPLKRLELAYCTAIIEGLVGCAVLPSFNDHDLGLNLWRLSKARNQFNGMLP